MNQVLRLHKALHPCINKPGAFLWKIEIYSSHLLNICKQCLVLKYIERVQIRI